MTIYIFYEIVCNDPNIKENYVGQTKNFRSRKYQHKSNCNHMKREDGTQRKIYDFINKNGGWNNWTMRPLEERTCITHTRALIREQYWINEKKAALNREPTKAEQNM